MSAKSKKPRRARHALTIKDIPASAHAAISALPRGTKWKTHVALLQAAADLAKRDKNWFQGKLSVVSK